jgi:hypothetical protein
MEIDWESPYSICLNTEHLNTNGSNTVQLYDNRQATAETINTMHVDHTAGDTSYAINITIQCELKVNEHVRAQRQ